MKKWTQDIISSAQSITIPIMTTPGIEICGYHIKDAVTNGSIHYEAISRLNSIFPSAACTAIMDLTVEAEAFGAEIIFPPNEIPAVSGVLVSDYESIQKLQIPSFDKGRINEYLKANRLAANNITDKPVFAGCIGPFSLAGRLYDMTDIMIAIYTEPESIHLLLDKSTQFIKNYCKAIKETGVNGIIIAEPAAGLISDRDCSIFSSHYVKQIVEELQDDNFMIILHNCGNTGHCTQAMLETRAAGLHFGNKIDITKVLQECPDNILIMGNIDPVGIIKEASAQQVKEKTYQLLEQTSRWKNFVLSTGCDVPPNVPFENILAYYQAMTEYNSHSLKR